MIRKCFFNCIFYSVIIITLKRILHCSCNAKSVSDGAWHILPENSHIPPDEVQTLSLQIIPSIVDKFKIPYTNGMAGPLGKGLHQCELAEDYEHHLRRQGCYIGIYVCDTEFSGRCFWSFRRQCACPRLWLLKTYECRIGRVEIPLPDSPHKSMTVPIGECRVAVWIWVTTVVASLPLLWFIVFRGVRFTFAKLY